MRFWVPVVALAAITAIDPFMGLGTVRFAHLSGFQDDFFYYLTIARNLAEHGRSTFDGVSLTNGYHPLWTLVLAGLARMARADSVAFVGLLSVTVFGLILLSAGLMRRLARSLWPDASVGVELGAFVFVFAYAQLARTGMEAIVAIPAMIATVVAALACYEALSARRAFLMALSCSAAILARVDLVIFIAVLLIVAAMSGRDVRRNQAAAALFRPRVLVSMAIGLLPVVIYLIINETVFGRLMPQSGAAKQIRSSVAFNPRVWEFLLLPRSNAREFVYFFLVGTLPFLLTLAGVTSLLFRQTSVRVRITMLSLGGFMIVYYTLLSFMSDWALWIWYLYPAVTAAGLATTLLVSRVERHLPRLIPMAVAAVLVAIAGAGVFTRKPSTNRILALGVHVEEFATTHPGTYAMGDMAGAAGFLLPHGLLQLEGLVSPPALLTMIRDEAPLDAVFQRFGVDYYVTPGRRDENGCVSSEEPTLRLAGEHSHRMRGLLCAAPLATFDEGRITTFIFDVRRKP